MSDVNVIEVDSVSKHFVINQDKSLKERIVNAARSRKHREKYTALNNISLEVKAGESLGLAGPNGSGKSTLLKLIGGILAPDSGEVRVRGRLAALLELGAGFHPDLTGIENIYLNASILGLTEDEIENQLDSIIAFSGISDFIGTQVKFYSSGMYVRLAFAVAVHSDPDILLVDEVLAVGDEPFQRKCMNKIHEFQEEGRSIILVSHSADQIIDVCDRAAILQKGELVTLGPVRDSMSVLHRAYQQERLKDAAIIEESTPTSATIGEVTPAGLVRLPNGQDVFISGDDLDLDIELSSDKPLKKFGIELEIENLAGTNVFGMDTRKLQLQMPEIEKSGTVRITLPHLYLGEDTYVFNVKVVTEFGVPLATKSNTGVIVVRSDGMTTGFVKSHPAVQVNGTPALPPGEAPAQSE